MSFLRIAQGLDDLRSSDRKTAMPTHVWVGARGLASFLVCVVLVLACHLDIPVSAAGSRSCGSRHGHHLLQGVGKMDILGLGGAARPLIPTQ